MTRFKIISIIAAVLLVGCDAMSDTSSVVDRRLEKMTVEVYREKSTGFYTVLRDTTGRVWEWDTSSSTCKQALNMRVGHKVDVVVRTTQITNIHDTSRNRIKQELILCP